MCFYVVVFCVKVHVNVIFCFCRFGSQSLTLSKMVPHICNLLGDPTSQVQPAFSMLTV